MRFPKCHFCKHDIAGISVDCFECDMGSNFVLKDRLTAKEQMEWVKLTCKKSSDMKLVGSIMDGYSYVDTDTYNTQMMANEIIKQTLNNIYGKKKEEKNMKTIDLYNLTRNNGLATIVAGGTSIPVRITDVEHESGIYTADTTTLTCEVQHVPAPLARRAAKQHRSDLIKNVYFNNPVTVVIWTDGSKTIVKANGEEPYDPEKGLAMAIAKKFMGDNETKSNYYDVFKKWLPKKGPLDDFVRKVTNGEIKPDVVVEYPDRWKIWVMTCDLKTGAVINRSIYPRDYATKYAAERAAKRIYGPNPIYTKWIVSKTNPWETEEK